MTKMQTIGEMLGMDGPEPGIKICEDMSHEKYLEHPSVSRSGLMLMQKSPQHYWWRYLSGHAEPEDTESLRIGHAFHCLLLEPQKFEKYAVVIPADAPKTPSITQFKAKNPSEETVKQVKWWTDFTEKAAGRTLIKAEKFVELKLMAAAILAQPAATRIIDAKGKIESSFFYSDPLTGMAAKARPDYWREDGIVLDLKTTADASRDAFERSIVEYGYDVQAYMQMLAIEQCTGKKPQSFVFICVEKEPPYAVAFYMADDDVLRCGEYRYHRLMSKYADCMKSGKWPGYGHLIQPIGMPPWFVKKLETQEQEKENE
jgi:hypothetical protein